MYNLVLSVLQQRHSAQLTLADDGLHHRAHVGDGGGVSHGFA